MFTYALKLFLSLITGSLSLQAMDHDLNKTQTFSDLPHEQRAKKLAEIYIIKNGQEMAAAMLNQRDPSIVDSFWYKRIMDLYYDNAIEPLTEYFTSLPSDGLTELLLFMNNERITELRKEYNLFCMEYGLGKKKIKSPKESYTEERFPDTRWGSFCQCAEAHLLTKNMKLAKKPSAWHGIVYAFYLDILNRYADAMPIFNKENPELSSVGDEVKKIFDSVNKKLSEIRSLF